LLNVFLGEGFLERLPVLLNLLGNDHFVPVLPVDTEGSVGLEKVFELPVAEETRALFTISVNQASNGLG
jgi:hypothetical protein